MDYIINFCKNTAIAKINLEVNSNNNVAIKLYKKYGFEQVGNRKNYYENGDRFIIYKNIIRRIKFRDFILLLFFLSFLHMVTNLSNNIIWSYFCKEFRTFYCKTRNNIKFTF